MHYALGRSGGTGGVDDGGELVGRAQGAAGQWRVRRAKRIPRQILAGRRGGKTDAAYLLGNPAAGGLLFVGGAEKAGLGSAVLQNVVNRAPVQGRIDRDADVSRHPDGQVGHDPPGAVSGKDRHPASGFPILRLKVSPYTPRFLARLRPGPLADLASAVRLGEKDLAATFMLPPSKTRERQILVRNTSHLSAHLAQPASMSI